MRISGSSSKESSHRSTAALFKSLSEGEQVRYLHAIWDHILKKPGELPVPKSHLSLAKERLAEYRRDPTRARPARDEPYWNITGMDPPLASMATPVMFAALVDARNVTT